MQVIISITPILLYLLGIKAMDAMSFTTWKRLSLYLTAGIASCLFACLIAVYVPHDTIGLMPFLEELLKAAIFIIPILITLSSLSSPLSALSSQLSTLSSQLTFFAEAMVYGMAVGAGFALVENLLYITYNEDLTLLHCLIRGFGTALIHMGCTALVATLMVHGSRLKVKGSGLKVKGYKVMSVIAALVVATALHTTYNLFLLPPVIQLLVTIVVFLVLFMGIYHWEEKLVDRWLDTCISDDIKLLGAIKDGNLGTTRAGEYLIGIRNSFHPETFFDMLVFLQLYLELSIKAKSRLMLREADIQTTIIESEHEEDLQRIKELKTLRSNIGIAGLSVLAPLVHEKDADKWVINELL